MAKNPRTITLYLDIDVLKELRPKSDRMGFSISGVTNRLLETWMAAGCPMEYEIRPLGTAQNNGEGAA